MKQKCTQHKYICIDPNLANEEVKVLDSHGQLFVTPWTVACQAPLSMEFPRQEYWSGLPFPSPRDLPDPGIKMVSHIAGRFFTIWAIREAQSSLSPPACHVRTQRTRTAPHSLWASEHGSRPEVHHQILLTQGFIYNGPWKGFYNLHFSIVSKSCVSWWIKAKSCYRTETIDSSSTHPSLSLTHSPHHSFKNA